MKIIKTQSGVEVKIFSSAKDMPIGRYSIFQSYLVKNIGVESFLAFLNRAKVFLQEGDFENAEVEINNSITGVLSLNNGIGLHTHCFAILVAEIDGKQARDTTDEGLGVVIEQLKALNITQAEIEDSVEEVKKKSITK